MQTVKVNVFGKVKLASVFGHRDKNGVKQYRVRGFFRRNSNVWIDAVLFHEKMIRKNKKIS